MISAGQQNQGMPGVPQQPPSGGTETGLTPNIAGLLCYLPMFFICGFPLSGLIFLLIEKDNKYVRFHAWQSVLLGGCFMGSFIGLKIFGVVLGMISEILEVIVAFFIPILILAAIILWILCMVKAYQGERWIIPYIGDFAAKKVGI